VSRYDDRFTVRPGLTGLAQVLGSHASRSSLFLDRRYIARQGVWLDARLIALSFAINALGKQRVRQLIRRPARRGINSPPQRTRRTPTRGGELDSARQV
jgi:hypothetical protein